MSQLQRRELDERASTVVHGKYRLDRMCASRVGKRLVMFEPDENVIADVVAKARVTLTGLAPTSEGLRLQRYNPDCIMALASKAKFDPAHPVAEGFIAILPLNSLGVQILALGSFDFTAFAIAIAGKICPPVPPPATMILICGPFVMQIVLY